MSQISTKWIQDGAITPVKVNTAGDFFVHGIDATNANFIDATIANLLIGNAVFQDATVVNNLSVENDAFIYHKLGVGSDATSPIRTVEIHAQNSAGVGVELKNGTGAPADYSIIVGGSSGPGSGKLAIRDEDTGRDSLVADDDLITVQEFQANDSTVQVDSYVGNNLYVENDASVANYLIVGQYLEVDGQDNGNVTITTGGFNFEPNVDTIALNSTSKAVSIETSSTLDMTLAPGGGLYVNPGDSVYLKTSSNRALWVESASSFSTVRVTNTSVGGECLRSETSANDGIALVAKSDGVDGTAIYAPNGCNIVMEKSILGSNTYPGTVIDADNSNVNSTITAQNHARGPAVDADNSSSVLPTMSVNNAALDGTGLSINYSTQKGLGISVNNYSGANCTAVYANGRGVGLRAQGGWRPQAPQYNDGIAILADNSSTVNPTISTTNNAVGGNALAINGNLTMAGHGQVISDASNDGFYVQATGNNYHAVIGEITAGVDSIGVLGKHNANVSGIGVKGEAVHVGDGTGVWGTATNGGVGVYGDVGYGTGYAGYFRGGVKIIGDTTVNGDTKFSGNLNEVDGFYVQTSASITNGINCGDFSVAAGSSFGDSQGGKVHLVAGAGGAGGGGDASLIAGSASYHGDGGVLGLAAGVCNVGTGAQIVLGGGTYDVGGGNIYHGSVTITPGNGGTEMGTGVIDGNIILVRKSGGGQIIFKNLPVLDPGVPGAIYNSGGFLKISP